MRHRDRQRRAPSHNRLHLRLVLLGVLAAGLVTIPTTGRAQGRVETVTFDAASVARTMTYRVGLPAGYETPANAARRYPTIYLLHGEDHSYRVWTDTLDIATSALDREVILVMPDAGNSFYVDWAESNGADAWERYIVDDLLEDVDRRYRTLRRREARAITGFSMGGYGALTVGLRNPETFGSVGSQSGRLDYARDAAARLRMGGVAYPTLSYTAEAETRRQRRDPALPPGFSSIVERSPVGQPFTTSRQADAHDPFMLVMRVRREELPFIQIDSGTGDPRLFASQRLASLLLDADIPFDYLQLPGRHEPEYWIRAYGHVIGIHYETMMRALGRDSTDSSPR